LNTFSTKSTSFVFLPINKLTRLCYNPDEIITITITTTTIIIIIIITTTTTTTITTYVFSNKNG
jgi:hypothetical protein